ncbi:hypothetical protein [Gluconobacter oxydans]|uniref:hypothetical protein n=1 Tax=Gluconobacter oxydans TaxID=442 RepID=UPI0039EBF21F
MTESSRKKTVALAALTVMTAGGLLHGTAIAKSSLSSNLNSLDTLTSVIQSATESPSQSICSDYMHCGTYSQNLAMVDEKDSSAAIDLPNKANIDL